MAYFVEAGIVLTIAPWTAFWERNYFVMSGAAVRALLMSPWLRGAVSGVGILTMAAGLLELLALFVHRSSSSHPESAGTGG